MGIDSSFENFYENTSNNNYDGKYHPDSHYMLGSG